MNAGMSTHWPGICILNRRAMLPAYKPHASSSRQFPRDARCGEFLRTTTRIVLALATLSGAAYAANSTLPASPGGSSDPAIVVGFVGGFVHHDDRRHAEVQLAHKLRAEYGERAHVAIFENHHLDDAHVAILKWLDPDGNGQISEAEKHEARIILYGHSWGASAVVALARELQKDQLPVLLTIQVDSISKPGQDDHTIPANVAHAVNFYQTGGALHGEQQIVAADPTHTKILGDFRFEYTKQPPPCSVYPWFARHFMKGHTSIECDPKVWSRVEELIGDYLFPNDNQSKTAISRTFQSN